MAHLWTRPFTIKGVVDSDEPIGPHLEITWQGVEIEDFEVVGKTRLFLNLDEIQDVYAWAAVILKQHGRI